ncbi:MAG: helix-turn-helix domain containing protein [Candidatus Omnitrophica bacterium]|nr:helix-turn-helix domain containing protein [Candidatus Omnitrophota bacterium]
MDEYQREDLIKKVELREGHMAAILDNLGIPRSTYYKWRRTYDEDGMPGLKPIARRIWNRLEEAEVKKVFEVARLHPELSPRLLAVKITDEQDFSVSESTVYRILKKIISLRQSRYLSCRKPNNGCIRQPSRMSSGSLTPPTFLS